MISFEQKRGSQSCWRADEGSHKLVEDILGLQHRLIACYQVKMR